MRLRKGLCAVLLPLALAACGGGGDSQPTAPDTDSNLQRPSVNPVEQALATGNALLVPTTDDLYSAILTLLKQRQEFADQAYLTVMSDSPFRYAPGQQSQVFQINDISHSFPLVQASNNNRILAVAGVSGDARYAGFGTNLLTRLENGDSEVSDLGGTTARLINWLIAPRNAGNQPTIKLALLGSDEQKHQDWLQANIEGALISSCPDPQTLASCIAGSDLVVIGDNQASDSHANLITTALDQARASGTGVLYSHQRAWNQSAVTDAIAGWMGTSMPYAGNYFSTGLADWDSGTNMTANLVIYQTYREFFHRLRDGTFNIDWQNCPDGNCLNAPGMDTQFTSPVQDLRASIRSIEQNGRSLFTETNNRFLKLTTLLADLLRQDIHYPMDRANTAQSTFLRAYFADHIHPVRRPLNPAQPDLGNFSDPLPAIKTASYQRQVATTTQNSVASTGLYALPGQTVTITRTDSLDTNVGVKINHLRSGTTREWEANGYARPKFVASTVIPLPSGKPVTLTSAYGGPVYLSLTGAAVTGDIKITTTGATTYPHLTDLSQATEFVQQVRSTPLNWTGIQTDFVEVTSIKHHMVSFLDDDRYRGDVTLALEHVWQYMIQGTYNLAGFSGPGLSLNSSVVATCTALGWDCNNAQLHRKPAIQHVNSDNRAHCGYGCSGNPYDQAWPLNPLGWGESHEIGHNLQRGRLKIYDVSGEVSNNIFPLYKAYQFYHNTNEALAMCTRTDSRSAYNILNSAQNQGDPLSATKANLWINGGNFVRLAFYEQLHFLARDLGLGSGWDLFTLMYLHERQFSLAVSNDTQWLSQQNQLGFAGINHTDAAGLSGNDFMLVSASVILNRDLTAYFSLWGVETSATAQGLVAHLGSFNPGFYQSDTVCRNDVPTAIMPDGSTAWP
ncbi:ImpA family metalloprotease [Marinobacter zhejiangensis]|uniref:Peptidase M60, enhancin and enhancin-like n=1 Tax=Marinobacter zhejiangensis TaxID=488535 RepID=A0A1I4NAY8_9GAMM|nr:ImpA family metalloprotease [Marinobacter zhejiangensis]SFM12658.1 Peptidase M60, enhancin and enhancin-like [Marinobacter zhejiangensis]